MRVLFATDGSASARNARDLVRSLAWPDGTTIQVLQVLPPLGALVDFGGPGRREAIEATARAALHELSAPLRRNGLVVDERLVRGAGVADLIVTEARKSNADLVVVGSRGHGTFATILLGSVGAAVTDHAPCPVLVARRPRLDRVVFAEDGSESAFEARRLLTKWPMFHGLQVRVVSVAHVTRPYQSGITATVFEGARQAEADIVTETRAAHERLAKESAEQLRLAGVLAQAELRQGDAAVEIVAAAAHSDADLVVVGSRGRSGVTRAVLGSVARNVLHHAHCSVLIARPSTAVRIEDAASTSATAH
ncbi:MAG TPA: hypothetical protein DCK98_02745 [Chloroflexi bacterium]|jgi:nucleotide-binding universal stress UspA family protein|nr:hypothetical protein [Chloroflexota bacterium]